MDTPGTAAGRRPAAIFTPDERRPTMIRSARRNLAAVAATALIAGGGLALSASAALASATPPPGGNDDAGCVNALIAENNTDNVAIGDDQAGNASAAAAENAVTAGYAFTSQLQCYYTPYYSAYQDTITAATYVSSAESANQGGNSSSGYSYEEDASSYINAALTLELKTGAL
jgi:hypothetical protein